MAARVRSRSQTSSSESYAPVVAGLILDAFDFATLGPIGLYAGLVVGGVAGWWLAPSFGFSPERRWLCALLAGVYCTLPFTSYLPVATVLGLASRLGGGGPVERPGAEVIDVEFRPAPREPERDERR